ncbi:oxygen-independent coproporphyrinogen III oxidase [Aquimarina brevivitae]|uniref:Coproporphyrinogen-III oxidase n=1 Tax=Aquimarina brevivitae TaxID=323412 RepID=A0A4Q7PGP9_9FLAO|nr:oxygen-independent coproporphyrinogen III oxidase [Aquimarina brevivitae]RZS99686.1 oxygen-independent coproporphyrinogen-3 oxidase [Aquimarina brevivitae]
MCSTLVNKYNIPGPRYTSYPTVPYWDNTTFSLKAWTKSVKTAFDTSNDKEGISLYIHLPFCESMCTFCGCNKRITKRHDVEIPYIKSVLKEWDLYQQIFEAKPKLKELHLGGGTPTFFSPENLKLLLQGILKHTDLAENYEFSFEGHPNNTTKEHLQTLYDLGFRRVSFGVQDYDHKVQKAIHRIQSFEAVKYVTETAREIGYTSVGHDIIFGLPHQTSEAVRKTILKTKELTPDRLAYYSYAHVPWQSGNGQRGFDEKDIPAGEEKRKQYETGKSLLEEVGYAEIGMDHFAQKKDSLYQAMQHNALHRNFMGYTASKTKLMIGLGVSAIGDSWTGFAQNVKGVEEYNHLLAEGILPVYRGHILSKKDTIIRKHILDLMCTFKTSFQEDGLSEEEKTDILERLHEMIADDLVALKGKELKITTKGKPFVRNICMAFDLRLQDKKPDTKLFSMTV